MKNTKSLNALSSVIIGTLMFLLSITYLPVGGLATLVGVFALLVGLFYVAVGFIFLSGIDEKNKSIKKIIYPLTYMVYACYYFIFDLITIIAGVTQNFEAIGWIMIILRMISSLLVVTLSVIALVSDGNEKVENACSVALTIFVCSLIVGMVFDNQGNQIALGDIEIPALVILVCYTYIANRKNQKIISGIANQFTALDHPKQVENAGVNEQSDEEVIIKTTPVTDEITEVFDENTDVENTTSDDK